MPHPRPRGFTWIDVLTALALVSTLLVIAVPVLSGAIARHQLRGATSALVQTLQEARASALHGNRMVEVCPSRNGRSCTGDGDWGGGWITRATMTRDIIAIDGPPGDLLTVVTWGERDRMTFGPPAGRKPPPGNQRVALCVRGRGETTIAVVVATGGHSHVEPASPEASRACGAHRRRKR